MQTKVKSNRSAYREEGFAKAYLLAEKFAKDHYENFPVVSLFVPKKLRKHVAIIYWFARTADDFADEGNASEEVRLEELNKFEEDFKSSLNGKSISEYFDALNNTISERNLTTKYFFDLLSAFKQDVITKRYSDFDELLDYCSRSANPVGRLILELFEIKDEKAFSYSDSICTALQITNFLQDIKIDYNKGRIYLPQNEMLEYRVEEKLFEHNKNNDNLAQFMKFNVQRTQKIFDEGRKLIPILKGRLKYEIGWTVAGGEKILDQIGKNNYNAFATRPKLGKVTLVLLFIKSVIKYI